MAKKRGNLPGQLKKGQIGKKQEVEKLINKSKASSVYQPSSQSRALLEMGPAQGLPLVKLPISTNGCARRRAPYPPRFQRQPKQPQTRITPTPRVGGRCQEPDFLILDRRDPARPDIELIRLPREPEVPRSQRTAPAAPFRFLDLPAELRNKIYEQIIQPDMYALDWHGDSQRSRSLTHRLPMRSRATWPRLTAETIKRRETLRRNPRTPERKQLMDDLYRQSSPVALLLVNKQMHREASTIFYGASIFAFDLLGTLRYFLDHLTPASKQAIRTLNLTYNTYGYPGRRNNQGWKDRHDRVWEDLCWRVSDELPTLTHLTLHLNMRRSPLLFPPLAQARYDAFGTAWMMPLWAFQGINLQTCWLRLYSDTIEDAVLAVESRRLRRQILEQAWDEEVEHETRDWFGTTVRVMSSKKDGDGDDRSERAARLALEKRRRKMARKMAIMSIARNGQVFLS